MLRTGVDAPIEIIMPEIPRLARVDRLAAASTERIAGRYLAGDAPPQSLMRSAVATSSRFSLLRHAD